MCIIMSSLVFTKRPKRVRLFVRSPHWSLERKTNGDKKRFPKAEYFCILGSQFCTQDCIASAGYAP